MESEAEPQEEGILTNIANFFKPKQNQNAVWQEFPWDTIILKQDPIEKWASVDMRAINKLHSQFDTETGRFIEDNEARSEVNDVPQRPSAADSATN